MEALEVRCTRLKIREDETVYERKAREEACETLRDNKKIFKVNVELVVDMEKSESQEIGGGERKQVYGGEGGNSILINASFQLHRCASPWMT